MWFNIPTAESLYQRTPSADALNMFAACTIAGLGYSLAAMIIVTGITYVFVTFTGALQSAVHNIQAI